MDSPCAGCDGRCCVGRSVALGASDVRRLQATLGLPWAAFAAVVGDDDGFLLEAAGPRYGFRLRHADDGSCVFAVTLGNTRRCGVHAVRPLSCRVYPWHVAVAPPTTPRTRRREWPASRSAATRPARRRSTTPGARGSPTAATKSARARRRRRRVCRDAEACARWNAAVASSGRRPTVDDYLATTARPTS